MKKILAAVLAAAVLFASACGNYSVSFQEGENGYVVNIVPEDKEDAGEEIIGGNIVGGWTVNGDLTEAGITDEEKEIFEKALEGLVGASYVPVAVLAKQLVSGTNYLFLAAETLVTADPVDKTACVTVYQDLEGNITLLGIENVDITDFTDEEDEDDDLLGAWSINEALTAAELPAEVQEAFDAAMETLLGVDYTPVAYLGSQVVAGKNYAILCKAVTVTAEPVTSLKVVIVFDGVNGQREVRQVSNFELEDYVEIGD